MAVIREIEDELQTRRILGFLGLARRAGKLIYGKDGIKSYLRRKDGKKLVIAASDIGDRIFSDILRRIRGKDVVVLILRKIRKDELGSAIGKVRVSVVAIDSFDMIDGMLRFLSIGDSPMESR